MSSPDDGYVGPRWIPEEERTRIFQELMKGPRPQPLDPGLKASLLADVGPEEAELISGILDIVENGSASIGDLLEELDRMCEGNDPPPPA